MGAKYDCQGIRHHSLPTLGILPPRLWHTGSPQAIHQPEGCVVLVHSCHVSAQEEQGRTRVVIYRNWMGAVPCMGGGFLLSRSHRDVDQLF